MATLQFEVRVFDWHRHTTVTTHQVFGLGVLNLFKRNIVRFFNVQIFVPSSCRPRLLWPVHRARLRGSVDQLILPRGVIRTLPVWLT